MSLGVDAHMCEGGIFCQRRTIWRRMYALGKERMNDVGGKTFSCTQVDTCKCSPSSFWPLRKSHQQKLNFNLNSEVNFPKKINFDVKKKTFCFISPPNVASRWTLIATLLFILSILSPGCLAPYENKHEKCMQRFNISLWTSIRFTTTFPTSMTMTGIKNERNKNWNEFRAVCGTIFATFLINFWAVKFCLAIPASRALTKINISLVGENLIRRCSFFNFIPLSTKSQTNDYEESSWTRPVNMGNVLRWFP